MTNFEVPGLLRIKIGSHTFRVVDCSRVEDLTVYDRLGQTGFAKVDGEYRIVYVSDTADQLSMDRIAKYKFVVGQYGYDTVERLKQSSMTPWPDDDLLYKVVGQIDNEGYDRIVKMKIGFYEKF